MGDRNERSGWTAECALDDVVAGWGTVRMINIDRQDLVTLDQRLADRCDLEHAL